MKKLLIKGGNRLVGTIHIAGAKNAALPLMVASILTAEDLILTNIPHVADVATMVSILASLGIAAEFNGAHPELGNQARVIRLNAGSLNNFTADYELVRKMRASVLVLGPLLARFGQAKISLPGGCAIGVRPIDLHLKALKEMGAHIEVHSGYVEASVNGKLRGCVIEFEKISVGATQSILMAACLASGKTIIKNAASEPEIQDLARCLNSMGAKIIGAGTREIEVQGVDSLHGTTHQIVGDRIEAGTYAAAAAMTNGELEITGVNISLFEGFADAFVRAGLKMISPSQNSIKVSKSEDPLKPVNISTAPFPGFPTDMQAQFMAMMTIADGESIIEENLFENRFMHVLELARMGADIELSGHTARVKGVAQLEGAEVMATDLRASVSLVLAGLAATGETIVNRIYHLERGYEGLAEKLRACGADIKVLN